MSTYALYNFIINYFDNKSVIKSFLLENVMYLKGFSWHKNLNFFKSKWDKAVDHAKHSSRFTYQFITVVMNPFCLEDMPNSLTTNSYRYNISMGNSTNTGPGKE